MHVEKLWKSVKNQFSLNKTRERHCTQVQIKTASFKKPKFQNAYFDETMIWEGRKHIGALYCSIILAFYKDFILIWGP